MKLQIQKILLDNALAKVVPFTNQKDTSNITSTVMLNMSNDILTLFATDYEMGLKATLVMDNLSSIDGFAVVNGKKLYDIVKVMKNDFITLEVKGEMLNVAQNKSRFKTPISTDEFPSFPNIHTKNSLNLDSALLMESLRKITPSIDANNPKYALNGALIDIKHDRIYFVSTDTRRLSTTKIESSNENELSLIIPKRAIVEVQKLFHKDINIYFDDTYMAVESNQFFLYTKLINGEYPDFNRVIPSETIHNLLINKLDMIENIKPLTIISNEINISIENNVVSLTAITDNQDKNTANTEFEISEPIPEQKEILVNSRYLLDFLNTVFDDTFTLSINDSNVPFVLESDGLKTVVMPIVL